MCCDLALSSLAELCVATKFLYRNTIFVVSQFCPRRDNFLWSPSVSVATTLSCRDLTVFPFTGFCVATSIPCRNLTFSSLAEFGVATSFSCRDQAILPFTEFCVATSFLCRDTISVVSHFDPWSQLPFHVATSYLVFCPHASCDSIY